jgi:hypothetical protein
VAAATDLTVSATPSATSSQLVIRDSSRNFAANVITANLSGAATLANYVANTANFKTTVANVSTLGSVAPTVGLAFSAVTTTAGGWGYPALIYGAASNTNATTTSTTDVAMTTMTVTPTAGTWAITFTGTANSSTTGAQITTNVYLGGVVVANTTRASVSVAASADTTLSNGGVLTCNGSQSVAVFWKTSAGTGTVKNRNLTALRVA